MNIHVTSLKKSIYLLRVNCRIYFTDCVASSSVIINFHLSFFLQYSIYEAKRCILFSYPLLSFLKLNIVYSKGMIVKILIEFILWQSLTILFEIFHLGITRSKFPDLFDKYCMLQCFQF